MNSTLYTAVLVGQALVLVAMFGFGFYWLAIKDHPAQPTTPTPLPRPLFRSMNSTNGRRTLPIPITLSVPRKMPAPSRAIAIHRSVGVKHLPTHPLGPKLATTCTTRSNR
ncbi:hypothetical protein [Burkholderia ambifaria]|uniref:hypothetical protein n=1 Tax=Burkholderia ambifaria TaxID=152480 RepID=UPI00158E5B7F|nr:hypothetical protein [Burkholderia ambifaria]